MKQTEKSNENNMESETGRTTRSRRGAAKSEVKTTPPRATRSTRGRASKEEAPIEIIDEIEQMDTDQSEDPTIEANKVLEQLQNLSGNCDEDDLLNSGDEPLILEPQQTIPLPTEDNSGTFPFGEDQTNTLPHAEESSEPITTLTDSDFVASLAVEDNANSLPSENLNEDTNASLNEVTEEVKNETGSSDNALAEDIANGDSNATETKADPDAEMVSEDELPPAPEKIIVKDADEVSDEELPGPKMAELPEDTEVVSEDELKMTDTPKRKHEDGDAESSPKMESVEKKAKIDGGEKTEEKKKLPDLDKYWKAVNDDSTDFTAWTYLLQYVDHENDIEAAREAYDAFLAHYCYCYGYWRKYADYEKRKGNKKKCEEVFERGLKAIPLSVDLWIHYLAYCKETQADNEDFVRSQFERALNACGLEFRSDKLWEAYIRWENEGKRVKNVVGIYDRLLATPTQGYTTHFENFQELVSANSVLSLISVKEFKKIRDDLRAKEDKVEQSDDVPPGEDEPDDHYRNDEELQAIKNKIISIRKKIHKANVSAVSARWTYEEGIKRPYFHVKPLERVQLKNWKDYLDYEIQQGNQTRILVLFERCLIACALYDEFWLKLIRYLETQTDENAVARTRDAYERACTIHHPDKPSLHLMWAGFEEAQGNVNKAAEILATLDNKIPNILQVAYKRINVERRRGDLEKCVQLYENYINNAKNKNLAANLAIKYARFLNKIKKDIESAVKVLKGVIEKDPSNTRVALQLIDLLLQRENVNEAEVVEVMDVFVGRESIEPEQRVLFAQRKVEFLEDFGKDCKTLQEAQKQLQTALAKANDSKKKSDDSSRSKSKDANPPLPASTGSYTGTQGYNYGATQQAYYNDPNYQYGYAQWNQQYNYYGGYSGYNNYGY